MKCKYCQNKMELIEDNIFSYILQCEECGATVLIHEAPGQEPEWCEADEDDFFFDDELELFTLGMTFEEMNEFQDELCATQDGHTCIKCGVEIESVELLCDQCVQKLFIEGVEI